MNSESLTAVILAAGKSTRMNSALPKVLHPIFGRTMIDYVLAAARDAGVTRSLVVIGHEGESVRAALRPHADVEFVWQHNPQGTGHAVKMCADALRAQSGRVLVLAGDTPLLQTCSLRALLDEQVRAEAACVIGTARTANNFGLGRIVRDANGAFLRIVEQKDATPEEQALTEINTGCYAFEIPSLLASLEQLGTDNRQGEMYLTDCPAAIAKTGRAVIAAPVLTIEEAMGVNTREQLADVRRVMHWNNLQRLMRDGVGVLSPEHVDIDPRATIGRDTLIHPYTVIQGACRIGSGCTLGPSAVIANAVLADGETVDPFEVRRGEEAGET